MVFGVHILIGTSIMCSSPLGPSPLVSFVHYILCNLDSDFVALTNWSYLCVMFDKVHPPLSCQVCNMYK